MSSVATFSKASPFDFLQRWLPKLVLAPSMFIVLVGFYGYILWTFILSFTNSTFLPTYKWVGLAQYARLFDNDRWWVASKNLALFGGLFIGITLVIGVMLAVFLDQRIRREGFIRTIYLYPMALSMIVTGTAWKWLLNPGMGLDKLLRDWGWEGFRLDWLIDPDRVVYCLVIAAVWQASGFIMAMFLAGLRGVDQSIIRAAQKDLLESGAAQPASGVLQCGDDPGAHRDQELRPGGGDDRWRSWLLVRPAGDVHVFLHLQSRPDGHGLGQCDSDARCDSRDHRALPVLRAEDQAS